MFEKSLLSNLKFRKAFTGGACSRDSDCNFNPFLCLGECDLMTHTCTGKLKSSNLLVSNIAN